MKYIKIDQGAGGTAFYGLGTLDEIEDAVGAAYEAQLARVTVYETGVPIDELDDDKHARFGGEAGMVLVLGEDGDTNRWAITRANAPCAACTLGVVINGSGEIRGCTACRRFDPGGLEVVRFVGEGLAALRDLQAILWPAVPGANRADAAAIAEASWSPDTAEAIGRRLDFLHPRHDAARKR